MNLFERYFTVWVFLCFVVGIALGNMKPGMFQIVNVGQAAHITAAALGGPRYLATLVAEERASTENGVWLCQNCGKLIDSDPAHHTVDPGMEA